MNQMTIEITTTDNLEPGQQQEAEELATWLNGLALPIARLEGMRIAFRPFTWSTEDQLIYYPDTRRLLVYWSVRPQDPLTGALPLIADRMTDLQLPAPGLVRHAGQRALGLPPLPDRPVWAFWTSVHYGGPHWRVRKMVLPEWYEPLDIRPLTDFLNQHAPLDGLGSDLQQVNLGFQAYRPEADPAHGLLHYLAEDQELLIEVPLPAGDFPRLIGEQRWMLGSSLLTLLALQPDPKVPGLDVAVWRGELERAFREEGFWGGE